MNSAQHITGTIKRAWNSHDGVTFVSVKTDRFGEMHGVLRVRGEPLDDLTGRTARFTDGIWALAGERS